MANSVKVKIDGDSSGFKKALSDINSSAEKSSRSMAAKLAAEYKKAGMSQSEAMKKAWSEIERDSKSGSEKVKENVKGIGEESKKTAKDLKSMKSSLSTINKAFTAVTAAGAAGFTVAAKAGMNFEAQMSTVGAISRASADDMQSLTAKAKQMGIDTAFSATEAGQAMEYMAMAGWKTDDMLNGIDGIMNLAAASGENLASVSDIVTDAMTAFGLSASESGRFSDVLASASSNANTNVGLMGETFKYVAPVAGAMGFSIEDTATAIGLMANAGIKASNAGTALRSTFTRLAKPPKEAAEAMDALNLQVTDATGNFKPLRTIMGEMRTKFAKLTAEEKTQYAAMIGGQEAMSGLLAIVNASESDFNKLTEAIDNSNGAAAEMAEVRMDNLQGSLTLLGSSFEGLGIAIYDKFGNSLKSVIDSGIEKINAFTDALSNGDLDGIISAIAAGITGIGVALLSLNAALVIQDVINVMNGLEAATNGVAAAQQFLNMVRSLDPIYLVISATAALTAAVWAGVSAYDYFIEQNSEIVQASQKIADASKQAAQETQNLVSELDNLTKKGEERITNAESEAYANEQLTEELYNLASQATLTADEKDRMKRIVGQLNDSIEDLNLVFDEETGKLNLTEDAVKDLIKQKLELAKANAMQDIYTEYLKEEYKAQAQAVKIAQDRAKAQEELNKIESEGYEVTTKHQGYEETHISHTKEQLKAMENLKKAIEGYDDSLLALKPGIVDSMKNMEALYTVAGVDLPAGFDESQAKILGYMDGVTDGLGEKTKESAKLGNDFVDGYVNSIKKRAPEAYDAAFNLSKSAVQGGADGQRSHSPSKETMKLGKDFDDGYAIGIEKNVGGAKKAAEKLVTTALQAVEDSRTEVQKVNDELNKELLDSEQKYLDESLRIEKEKNEKEYQEKLKSAKDKKERQKIINEHNKKLEEEEQKAYLDRLKETADKERKIFEALQKDIENSKKKILNTYNEMVDEAFDKIEDLEKLQSGFADKLKGYGSLTQTDTIAIFEGTPITEVNLADLSKQTQELKEYENVLMSVKERGDVPTEFFEMMRDMSVEEGVQFGKLLLDASDEDFDKYISDWKEKQETAERISKNFYNDETEELRKAFSEKFSQIPEDFFDIGEDSMKQFGDGFKEHLNELMAEVSRQISIALVSLTPTTAHAGGSANTYSDNRTININANGMSSREAIEAYNQNEIYEKHTRGW